MAGFTIQTVGRVWSPADMSKALSVDLRERVLAAVEQGLSHRAAAVRFGVSVSRWRRFSRQQGHAGPKALDGLWNAIGRIIDTLTPNECANYFSAAGYDPD